MVEAYDVIIVGAGPAGIFSALEITEISPGADVLILERGHRLERRVCPLSQSAVECSHCKPCHNVSGWGGAGAFSDGKITLTTKFGGELDRYVGEEYLSELIQYCDDWYLQFGAPDRVYGGDSEQIRHLRRRAAAAELTFIPARIRHLGTDRCLEVIGRAYDYLKQRVEIKTGVEVAEVLIEDGSCRGVICANGEQYRADYVVAAPGRSGSDWLEKQATKLGIQVNTSPVDVGVRVEVPALVTEEVTDEVYESKLLYYSKSFDDRVRTFCMCPGGEVTLENVGGLITVNGHSFENQRGENTNFALLVSKSFTEPFDEPIEYGSNIAALANMLGGGALVQRLGDLLSGRRSTPRRIERGVVNPTLKEATPGDLSLVLPYRHLLGILEMMEALDDVMPGVYSRHTLLYGVEAKFYSSTIGVDESLKTEIDRLYVAGDGAGITRGLAQSSASGVHVARSILQTT